MVAKTPAEHSTKGGLAESASFCSIGIWDVSAHRERPSRVQNFNIESKGSFSQSDDHVHFRVVYTVALKDSDDVEVGSVSAAIVASYKTEESAPNFGSDEMIEFGESVAIKDLFPYARKTLGDLALQVGFDARGLVRALDDWHHDRLSHRHVHKH